MRCEFFVLTNGSEMQLKIDGMMCGMCESHVNDAIRKAFPAVKKVTSSHGKGETVVISEHQKKRKRFF